jgi:hypothetical protein
MYAISSKFDILNSDLIAWARLKLRLASAGGIPVAPARNSVLRGRQQNGRLPRTPRRPTGDVPLLAPKASEGLLAGGHLEEALKGSPAAFRNRLQSTAPLVRI